MATDALADMGGFRGERVFVGYRYADKRRIEPLFPFGHGLSYTEFTYSDLELSHAQLALPGSLTVTYRIKNTGTVAGQEIVQLYVRDVQSTAFCPDKELKGFAKVHLEPGESRRLSIDLDERAFAARLDTAGLPDPDLVIRTSGEARISNFLLWQSAYSEYEFIDTLNEYYAEFCGQMDSSYDVWRAYSYEEQLALEKAPVIEFERFLAWLGIDD